MRKRTAARIGVIAEADRGPERGCCGNGTPPGSVQLRKRAAARDAVWGKEGVMQEYQLRYIENTREIAALMDLAGGIREGFESWYERLLQARKRITQLCQENIALLRDSLFPLLDDIYNAGEDEIGALCAFADTLMDWSTNLDVGVYVVIHDALLSMYRVKKDRNGIIRELYKLGMGLYYQDRSVEGIEERFSASFLFQNEMVFTEAGSYLKFFEEIQDEETRGYIIRALANVALCTRDRKRRIAVSSRILKIVKDPYYRELAPGLPWEAFLRKTNQQMSANRSELSRANLSTEELEAVFESCQEVFTPETAQSNPNIRWLWPYYDMEYSCGFASLATTLDRLERLMGMTVSAQYDVSGLYGNVQLPIYYGRLLRDNPKLADRGKRVGFLASAYRKMMRCMLSIPTEKIDDYFQYLVRLVITDYYETEGVENYREVTTKLMRRFCGRLYLRSVRVGKLLESLCGALFSEDPAFFDDIPFLKAIADPEEKQKALLAYARDCGLYHGFGLIKMDLERRSMTRNLFEREFQIQKLHTVSGHDDLAARESTREFADIALGYCSWYNGLGGYPEEYERTSSPYRQMTDAASVAGFLADNIDHGPEEIFGEILGESGKRFSPLVTACLADRNVRAALCAVLADDNIALYRELYGEIAAAGEETAGTPAIDQ